jgi:hypothetical protein
MGQERKQILEMLSSGKISTDEAESLLEALESGKVADEPKELETSGETPKYLRIEVEPKYGPGEHVNIKIPIKIIRAGVKLKSILPASAKAKVNTALGEKGMQINLDEINSESLDKILEALADFKINYEDNKEKVRIYCE